MAARTCNRIILLKNEVHVLIFHDFAITMAGKIITRIATAATVII
jgi:hypothetical protein